MNGSIATVHLDNYWEPNQAPVEPKCRKYALTIIPGSDEFYVNEGKLSKNHLPKSGRIQRAASEEAHAF
jgi:hypothetical protein